MFIIMSYYKFVPAFTKYDTLFCDCVEQKHRETDATTQREVLLQQQLKQKDEIIAALTGHLSRIQLETGWLMYINRKLTKICR